MNRFILLVALISSLSSSAQLFAPSDYCLVWSDEFNVNGAPNPANWGYETGCSLRNSEAQNYTNRRENSRVENGLLIIEALRENYGGCSYTSAGLRSVGKIEFQYGRLDVRAKIDTRNGSWPAIWLLGVAGEWPSCGEIDIMEFYNSRIHANVAWGNETQWSAIWDSQNKLVSELGAGWANNFHVWRIEWTDKFINLYVDDLLMNTTDVTKTLNGSISNVRNPFMQKHYLLLNQAIGGINGGDPSGTTFPMRYEIDYVRLYQTGTCKNLDCNWQPNGTAYLDACKRCVGGNTGVQACVLNCSSNMIGSNMGLENSTTADWTGWGDYSVSTVAFSENYGIRVGVGAFERVVSVLPNTSYTIKAKAYKSGGSWYRLGVKEHGLNETFTEQTNTAWGDVSHTFNTGNSTTARLYLYNGGGGTAYADDFEMKPTACVVTSISEEQVSSNTAFYPNPVENMLHFNESKTWELCSVIGETIAKGESETINMSSLPSGVYVVKTASGIHKIVKN